ISEVFEGRHGILRALFDGRYDRHALVGGLGREFPATAMTYKPWPTCRPSHAYIEATLAMMSDHALIADDVVRVSASGGELARGLFEPPAARFRPTTALDAKYSLPFALGLAISHGRVGL